MKRILFVTFYFEPDLCAGSFRNTPLAYELLNQLRAKFPDAEIDVITTIPNRYSTYSAIENQINNIEGLNVKRIKIPTHKSGFLDQILSFSKYFFATKSFVNKRDYDLVYASSSRLFTGFLGALISKKKGIPLYLDIRDIFVDTINDVVKNGIVKVVIFPIIKHVEKFTFNSANHINLISQGFEGYFAKYQRKKSCFSNGIDDDFLIRNSREKSENKVKTITYAGNIGQGQGLHNIIPKIALMLGSDYEFLVIGDGGAKILLEKELLKLGVTNVSIIPPVHRLELMDYYEKADYLFVHLNDFKAFEKVLPSKLFELATFPQPLICGIGGYARSFARENIDNIILFEPCDEKDFEVHFKSYKYQLVERTEFVNKFRRNKINQKMAETIIELLK
jgi:hypothetical protein